MTSIRLSKPSDLKSLLVIENNTNPSPWTEKQMQSSFDVGHHSFLCEDNNENVIGFVIYVAVEQEAHLLNIAVDNNYQRKGIGSILINHLKKQVQAMGINLITLEVRVSNSNAISFYKKHNFIEDAIRANYYSKPKPEDALLMSVRF
tara:strand:- start:944 stop:1384 length:441 start_codon:yes stop_codon:yes gene_type:complete